MYDIIIVGGGPAGMTAALYALRNGKSVLVLEKTGFGGQIVHSPKVENWPGTARMSGNEYADHFLEQILDQGAEVDLTEVVRVEDHGDRKTVTTADGETREARSVILATGVRHRELGLTGEREMTGEGVSYCAVLLAGKCSEVVMLQDLPEFTGEKKLQELLFSKPNVSARTGVKIVDLGMDEHVQLNAVTVEKADGTRETIPCDGLFVAIGLIPENEAFREVAKLDENGYFASPETCETGTPGIFAAGDCRAKSVRQLTTAAADGSVAALAACRYVDALQG